MLFPGIGDGEFEPTKRAPVDSICKGGLVKFSFIVPVYNADKYLDQCLLSIEKQTYQSIEIICVDNNSSDQSAEVIAAHMRDDSRVKFVSQPIQGASNARNAGLDAAQGDYIFFVDADDFIEPTLAERVLTVIEETAAEVVMFPYSQYFARLNEYRLIPQSKMNPSFSQTHELGSKLFHYTTPSVCLKAFNRALLEEHQIRFDPNIHYGEDLLFSFSALLLAKTVYQIHGDALYHYRKEVEGSITQNRAHVLGSSDILIALNKLDEVRTSNELPASFELAIFNQALNEARYTLNISTAAHQFESFYAEFSNQWKNRLLGYEREDFATPDLYDLFVVPESAVDVLHYERMQLKEANASLRKKNSELTKKCKGLDQDLKQAQAKLSKTRNSHAFKLGKALTRPFSLIKKILYKGRS